MIVGALVRRNVLTVKIEKARYCELIVFPLSFLVTWGLLAWSRIIPEEQALAFLSANLVWSLASSIQTQANLCLMFNLWSKEFRELIREGLTPAQMYLADCLFALGIGTINLVIFMAVLPLFCHSFQPSMDLLIMFPSIAICSLGLSSFVVGWVIAHGRSWAFLSWTLLQVVIMASSPFVPVSELPSVFRVVAYAFPFTYLFEYVRSHDTWLLMYSALHGLALLTLGTWYLRSMVTRVRRTRGLHQI